MLVDHIIDVTGGDFDAAGRRLDEVDDLIADISANPMSGVRLAPPLDGWLVRHGGRGRRLTLVFRADLKKNCVFVALVAFGGQDSMTEGETRKSLSGWACDTSTLRCGFHFNCDGDWLSLV